MTQVFDEAARQVRNASEGSRRWGLAADEVFLDRVGAIERHLAAEALLLVADREFPADLAQAIRECISTLSVAPEDTPAQPIGAEQALVLRNSPMLTQLHSLFHEVATRRLDTRFGLLSDDPHDNAVRLRRFDAVQELDTNATCPKCDSINITFKDEPRIVECYDCGAVFAPHEVHKRQA